MELEPQGGLEQVPTEGENHMFSILAITSSPVPHRTPHVPSHVAATVSRQQFHFPYLR